MKLPIKITAIICGLLCISCGSVNLKRIDKSLSFNKKTTFVVNSRKHDKTNTQKELSHLLLKKGFNVVSSESGKKAVEFKGDLNKIAKLNGTEILEIYSIKDMNSVYLIDVNYLCDDIFYDSYQQFNVLITDLNTNKEVMYARFYGDKSTQAVLKDLVEKLPVLN